MLRPTEEEIIQHWSKRTTEIEDTMRRIRAECAGNYNYPAVADDEVREIVLYLAAEVKRLEQELAGKEPDQSTSPAPLRRIVINDKSALNGTIVFNATSSVIEKLQEAECILKLTKSIFESNRLVATTDPKLFDFDQVVAWMESLA